MNSIIETMKTKHALGRLFCYYIEDYYVFITASTKEQELVYQYIINEFNYMKYFPNIPNADIIVKEIINRYAKCRWNENTIANNLNKKYSWLNLNFDEDDIDFIIERFTESVLLKPYFRELINSGFHGIYEEYVDACMMIGKKMIKLKNNHELSKLSIYDIGLQQLSIYRLEKIGVKIVGDILRCIKDNNLIEKAKLSKNSYDDIISTLIKIGYTDSYLKDLRELSEGED